MTWDMGVTTPKRTGKASEGLELIILLKLSHNGFTNIVQQLYLMHSKSSDES